MHSSIPCVLAALMLASCQPMQPKDEKALDPKMKPAAAASSAANADAPANPHAANPHAATTDPHAGLGDHAPPTGSPGLGFMPDYDGGSDGVGVREVRPDGAGARAGLQAGDVIVKFAGIPVADIEEYTAALGTVRVGDKIEILVKRGTESKILKATVGVSNR